MKLDTNSPQIETHQDLGHLKSDIPPLCNNLSSYISAREDLPNMSHYVDLQFSQITQNQAFSPFHLSNAQILGPVQLFQMDLILNKTTQDVRSDVHVIVSLVDANNVNYNFGQWTRKNCRPTQEMMITSAKAEKFYFLHYPTGTDAPVALQVKIELFMDNVFKGLFWSQPFFVFSTPLNTKHLECVNKMKEIGPLVVSRRSQMVLVGSQENTSNMGQSPSKVVKFDGENQEKLKSPKVEPEIVSDDVKADDNDQRLQGESRILKTKTFTKRRLLKIKDEADLLEL